MRLLCTLSLGQTLPTHIGHTSYQSNLFVRICTHQTFSLYKKANPANIQPAAVQSDLVYENTGKIFSQVQGNCRS